MSFVIYMYMICEYYIHIHIVNDGKPQREHGKPMRWIFYVKSNCKWAISSQSDLDHRRAEG
jgi:hypothetical protein